MAWRASSACLAWVAPDAGPSAAGRAGAGDGLRPPGAPGGSEPLIVFRSSMLIARPPLEVRRIDPRSKIYSADSTANLTLPPPGRWKKEGTPEESLLYCGKAWLIPSTASARSAAPRWLAQA